MSGIIERFTLVQTSLETNDAVPSTAGPCILVRVVDTPTIWGPRIASHGPGGAWSRLNHNIATSAGSTEQTEQTRPALIVILPTLYPLLLYYSSPIMAFASKSEDETPTALHVQDPRTASEDLLPGGGLDISPIEREAVENVQHISLSWRSWLVVFMTCFAIMAQVFVVTAAGSVIAFIVRDLGESALSGWVIQVCIFCPQWF